MNIKKKISSLKDELIELRRDFHKHPELGFEEYRTSKIAANYLEKCGLDVKRGIAKTGVVALLKGNTQGPTLLLRADMDALPIQEENEVPYKSVNNGVMHACGHDAHTAMLLVAAKILSDYQEKIKGNIKFVFQPNEEVGGAKIMVEEGVLETPHVNAAMGLHLWTPIESGKIGVTAGPITATLDVFNLKIKGKGGHTGYPENAVDPIIAAANIIQTIQTIQTREISALKPTIIMFTKIKSGVKSNIIPQEVSLEGTIRYFYKEGVKNEGKLKKRFERIVEAICKAYRTKYKLKFYNENQSVINDLNMTKLVRSTAEKVLGNIDRIIPYMSTAGEDFSEFVGRVPSVFYFVGAGNKEKKSCYPHHNPRFNIDEDAMSIGVEMHVRSALEFLNKYQMGSFKTE
ncbi:amidohydrolase [Candidatus Atribacteria bacterium HGW-Atribacteria-1]|nr:MAG: amidohydrolase [Candidatus Atribacteria bacterium HGW-Atribacteria-1]